MLPKSNPCPPRAGRQVLAWWLASSCAAMSPLGCSKPFRRVEAITLTSSLPAQKLVLHNRFGRVIVQADPGATEVRAKVTKIGRGATASEAGEALK
jgi:hypothetical protein